MTTTVQNPAPELPLVILLGDSIRLGYEQVVKRELAGTAQLWAPSENGAHTAHTLANLPQWLAGKSAALVHLNCGLHDMWRNDDGSIRHPLDVYLTHLAAVFAKLKELAPQAILVFALTTPVDQERQKTSGYGRIVRFNADIPAYNAAARQLAEAQGILVNDLYAVVEHGGTDSLIAADGVHFTPAGCERLGQAVASYVRARLAEA
jgi:lysophospholipase L1-like esterase